MTMLVTVNLDVLSAAYTRYNAIGWVAWEDGVSRRSSPRDVSATIDPVVASILSPRLLFSGNGTDRAGTAASLRI